MGKYDQGSRKGLVDWVGRQAMWSHVNRRNLRLKKTEMKDVHLKHTHISKELCTSQHCEESSHTVSGKSA